jgi:hypothetical protein
MSGVSGVGERMAQMAGLHPGVAHRRRHASPQGTGVPVPEGAQCARGYLVTAGAGAGSKDVRLGGPSGVRTWGSVFRVVNDDEARTGPGQCLPRGA